MSLGTRADGCGVLGPRSLGTRWGVRGVGLEVGLGTRLDVGGQPPRCPGQGGVSALSPWRIHACLQAAGALGWPQTHFPHQAGGWGLAGVGSAPDMDDREASPEERGWLHRPGAAHGEWGGVGEGLDELSPDAVRPRKTSRLATAMVTLTSSTPGKKEPKVPENR